MLNDERILLIEGTLLYGVNNKYLVGKLRGKGGSSLVYYGTRIEDDLPILIKEIYPFDRSNCIIRDNDQIVKINDDLPKEKIEKAEMLLDTCKNKALNEKALLSNLAINYYAYSDISIDCFSQFNTVYTIFQNKDDGCVLSTESKQSFLTYIKYIKRILEALEPLHNAGYLHLDIAPDNIYKTKIDKEEPVLKLIDFNSSIKISDVRSVKVLSSKEGFSAYEVLTLKRDKIGIQSDLYSVTACLFYWLKDRVPNAIDSINLTLNNDIDILELANAEILDKVVCLLKRGLHSNIAKRYQSASEMMEDVKNIIDLVEKTDSSRSENYEINNENYRIENIEREMYTAKRRTMKILGFMSLLIIALFIGLGIKHFSSIPSNTSSVISNADIKTDNVETINYDDGSVYVGETKGEMRHGNGYMVWDNGDTYDGAWEYNNMSGEGVFTTTTYVYAGNFSDGLKDGYGEINYLDKSQSCVQYYKGQWHNDLYNGVGEQKTFDGNVYKGDFKLGDFHGSGEYYIASSNSIFTGDFERGNQIYGILTYLDQGYYYKGPFSNAMLNGAGYWGTADGWLFKGEFTDFILNGEVQVTSPDGYIANVLFSNSTPQDNMVFKDVNGNIKMILDKNFKPVE